MPTINDQALEKTFSDLAYAHLRDKAPAMLDYLVAFQMLKQEDDGQRAIGIFGFEVNGQFYYVPAFFLNGEIRGLDSLYGVKSDMFMPLTDDWVDTIINRRPQALGEADTRSRVEAGVRVPNYVRLKTIPGGSGGGSINLKLGAAQMLAAREYGVPDLVQTINDAHAARAFGQQLDSSPKFAQAFGRHYSRLDLVDTMEELVTKLAQEEPVVLINSITDDAVDRLNDEQRKTVLEGGTVVIDGRPEVAKAQLYRSETKQQFTNPEHGGLHDVLWSDGHVGLALIAWSSTTGNDVFVYRVEDGKYCQINVRYINVVREYSTEELVKWLEEHAVPADKIRPNETGVFISRGGNGTGGFCFDTVRTGLDDIVVGHVRDHHYMNACDPARELSTRGDDGHRGNNGDPEANMYANLRIGGNGNHEFPSFSNRPSKDPNDRVTDVLIGQTGTDRPRYTIDTCIINARQFFWLEINHFTEKTEDSQQLVPYETYAKPMSEILLKASDFGDYNTVQEAVAKYAEALLCWTTGSDYNVKTASSTFTGRQPEVLRHLIVDLGLGEDDARSVIKEASSFSQQYNLVRTVKSAAELLSLPDERQNDSGGGFMSAFHPQQVPFEMQNKASPPNNRETQQYYSPFGQGVGDSNNTLNIVDKAEKSGQKEVFDAAALAGLIRSHTPTDLVDRFLPTITAGMDRIGRMLFLIYWHFEDFEERYGEQDLSEFIDNLKSVFEQLGDVIVFAKKRQLSGDPDHYGLGARPILDDGAGS